ncbi:MULTISPECIES: hypothetical protein [Prochlorococcus]|uniref:hypothetical protein n=1 Tax=Prochlorococcus TaxID=1218 RepID=UPI000B1754E6|nr:MULTISPECIES: hypothetical protein [Prochlorococcus]NMO83248.1 hypothetical protein [Prochlorococcus sp. P1344]NMP12817.1 hypothetical protein [Prochlorococcus sp.P1363]
MPFTVQPLCMVVRDQMACLQGIQRAWETHLQTKRLPAPPIQATDVLPAKASRTSCAQSLKPLSGGRTP